MNKQTHRTCVRMSAKEYSRLMERSRAAGLSANAWLMEQLAGNRPIISRNGVMSDFLCLLNQKGREINTVARAFNSGYGTAAPGANPVNLLNLLNPLNSSPISLSCEILSNMV